MCLQLAVQHTKPGPPAPSELQTSESSIRLWIHSQTPWTPQTPPNSSIFPQTPSDSLYSPRLTQTSPDFPRLLKAHTDSHKLLPLFVYSVTHTHTRVVLDADGVLSALSAAVSDQVGAVLSRHKLRLRSVTLHRPCKPTQSHTYTHNMYIIYELIWIILYAKQ